MQQNLFALTHNQLINFFVNLGGKPYNAKQLMQWIYKKDITDFAYMSNLSKNLITKLEISANLVIPKIYSQHLSTDGTIKWIIELHDKNRIETVYIPKNNRGTLCISSQVGCALDCSFCATGKQGFNRNLTSDEIITQLIISKRYLQTINKKISNVVFMGMGEPLLNEKEVYNACDLLLDDLAFGLSRRKVTISTSGIVPAIYRLADTSSVSLAISLHAYYDKLRNELVPINKKYPIAELLTAGKYYLTKGKQQRHILFEYVMLCGVNDSEKDAYGLVKLLKDISAKVNLIPFNPFLKTKYKTSNSDTISKFQDILHNNNITTITRRTRGNDIVAACGQLAGKVADKTKRYV